MQREYVEADPPSELPALQARDNRRRFSSCRVFRQLPNGSDWVAHRRALTHQQYSLPDVVCEMLDRRCPAEGIEAIVSSASFRIPFLALKKGLLAQCDLGKYDSVRDMISKKEVCFLIKETNFSILYSNEII
jgi:hypothetical protein